MKDYYNSGVHYAGRIQKLNSQTSNQKEMQQDTSQLTKMGKFDLVLSAISKWTMRDVRRENAVNQK